MTQFAMRQIPVSERPRERLLLYGVGALSSAELLAILLGSGTKGKSVLDLAEEILVHFGGLDPLLEASVAELMEIKGIGKAKAIQLNAVFGLALKCRRVTQEKKQVITSPDVAYEIAREEISHQKQEVMLVLLRDVRGCFFHREQVSVGTLSEVLVHPREIFYPAVRHKAHSFILAHNHPSGDPTPSRADLDLTRTLLHSSQVMGIRLDDHLIIGKGAYVSLRQLGHLGPSSKY
jgi:DNA repair protein RadC